METNILLYIMVAVFYLYAAYAYIIGAKSLSDGWNKAKGWRKYLFVASTFTYAILAIIIGIQYNEVAALLAGTPLLYVIAAPNYEDGGIWKKVHYGGAIIAVLGAFYFFVIMGFWWLILAVLFLFCVSWIFEYDKSKATYWIEIWVMTAVIFMYLQLRN